MGIRQRRLGKRTDGNWGAADNGSMTDIGRKAKPIEANASKGRNLRKI
jgi:hypothetical protein